MLTYKYTLGNYSEYNIWFKKGTLYEVKWTELSLETTLTLLMLSLLCYLSDIKLEWCLNLCEGFQMFYISA